MEDKELTKEEIQEIIKELDRNLVSRVLKYQKAEVKEDEESKNL